jgi:acetyl-CoA acetyltransferase
MRKVVVLGVGMHAFGKFIDKSLMELGRTAIWNAIKDGGIPPKAIEVAYVGNSLGGLVTGQEGVRGQVILRDSGLSGMPVVNVENACASGTTAFRGAWMEVASGVHDVALAVGVEKLFLPDTAESIRILAADSDIRLRDFGFQFTAHYAMKLRKFMDKYGCTKTHFAQVVEKNSANAAMNPYAQNRKPLTVEQVLNSRLIAEPLHLYMCAPMGDGAAAAILCTEEIARRYTQKPFIQVAACALRSGMFQDPDATDQRSTIALTADKAYEQAGIGPADVQVAEVHDAMAPVELSHYEELGFCAPGESLRLLEEGRTRITGDIAVNPSGGLAGRGHPVAATGMAQVAEIVWQLRGEAGGRQVSDPKVGLIQTSGGYVHDDTAAAAVIVLKK